MKFNNLKFSPNTSSELLLEGVTDGAGAILSDATIAVSMKNGYNFQLVAGMESLTLTPVVGVAGSYQAATPILGDLLVRSDYVLKVTIQKGPDQTVYELTVPVKLP